MKICTQKNIIAAAAYFVINNFIKLLVVFFLFFQSTGLIAQVTVIVTNSSNTTPNLQASYSSLALALTDLNSVTAVSGPVTLTCAAAGAEVAPAGGFIINFTATTSLTNNIVINGSGSTVTAGLQTAGSETDAVFKITGSDYITLQNFIIQENTGNTITSTGAANTMTEWGIALLRATTTDGARNNTILNNTISLNRAYANSFAVYSNVRHASGTPSVAVDINSPAGANINNKVYGNLISNVNYGIVFVGSGVAGNMDSGNDIGGSSTVTGNMLTNWGSSAVNSGVFVSVSASMWGIYINQQTGINVSYNSLTSAAGIIATAFRGIFMDFSVAVPTGTFTNSITNNSITLNSAGTTGTFECIRSQGMTSLSTATININSNSIIDCVISGISSASTMLCIINSSVPGTLSLSNNIIRGNTSSASTGGFTGISNSGTGVNSLTINNNQVGNVIGGAITFSAATSGTVTGIVSSGNPAASAAVSIQNNDIRGIVHTIGGTGNHTYISMTGATAAGIVATIAGNTFTNMNVNTTGTTTFISQNYNASSTSIKNTNNNAIVTAYVRSGAGGTVTLILDNASSVTGSVSNCQNNNFSNITLAGTTVLNGLNYSDGGSAPSRTVSGNILNNWTVGTGTVNAMNFSHWNGISSLLSNTITNITGQGTITGITIGSTVNTATSVIIADNIISNLTSTGAGGTVTGIKTANTSPVLNFNNNRINTLSSTGESESVTGISATAAATLNIFKNRIYDLSGDKAGTTVNGINISAGTTLNIYNNLIGDLKAPAATGLNAIIGINASGTAAYNVYYNSVYLSASSNSVTGFGTSCITFSNTVSSFNCRNNILYNSSVPAQEGANLPENGITACLRRSIGTEGIVPYNYAVTSNHNAYWVNPAAGTNNHLTYVEGTVSVTNMHNTLANMKTFMVNRDQGSVQENILWQTVTGSSADFLKYNVGSASQVESGAVNIASYTDDYSGTIRQGNGGYSGTGNSPDIGAWELNGISNDLTGPYITYTPMDSTSCLAGRTFSPVIISDAGNVNTSSGTRPRLYYKKSGNANTFNDNTNATDGWKYVEASGVGGSPFGFNINYPLLFGGSPAINDVIQYFVVAQDLAATPNISINSGLFAVSPLSVALTATAFPVTGTLYSYKIIPAGLSGTVTIGSAANYTSITGAGGLFSVINSGGLSENLVANIIDAGISETGTVVLNPVNYNGCAAGPYTLTIKPTVTSTISGSSASGLITINGADHVIIDGSIGSTVNSICPPANASRDLTITNTNPGTASAVVWLQSTGGDGATNNVIRNCNIIGNSSTTTLAGIGSGSSIISISSLGSGNNNNRFENNNIKAVQVGIYSQGAGASNKNSGTVINQNVMTNPSGSAQNIGTAGIFTGFENGISISGNSIGSVSGSADDVFGIACGSIGISTSAYTGNEVINAVITNNKIDSLRSMVNFSTSGIYIVSASGTGTNLVANNSLTNLGTNGTSGNFGSGIFIGGGAVTSNIYFNSVSLSGSFTGGTQPNFALAIGGNNPAVNIKNNILSAGAVTGSGTTSGLGEYAIGLAYSSFTNLISDNNDFFTSGAEARFAKTGSLVPGSGTNVTTLAAWQAATGQDAFSISANPLFNSLSNLRPLIGSPLINAGVPAGSITNDIACSTRNISTPAIGAYETAADVTVPSITYNLLTNSSCLTGRTLSQVIMTDASGINITAGTRPRLYYKKSTHANTFIDNTNATNGWKYVEATGAGGSPFSFTANYSLLFGGAPVLTDVIQYFVTAQDLAGTPNVSINSGTFATTPAGVALSAAAFPVTGLINSYTLVNPGLNGTVAIGAAGTYTSLTGAGGLFSAINSGGISADVTVTILDASVAETGTVALNAINYNGCAAGPYSLIIKPATGVTTVLTGNSPTSIIKLNGADMVTIDGSNSGSASRNMTIINTNTAVSGNAVLWLASASASDGASNNIIKNCIITGNGSTTTLMGIFSGGTASVSTTENARAINSGNIIQNNKISKSRYGIYVIGINTDTLSTGLKIIENVLGSSTAGDGFLIGGVDVKYQLGADISDNEVQNITGAADTTMHGINLQDSKSSSVSANQVHNINYSGSSTTKIYGITTSSSTFNVTGNQSANTFSNNVVYDLVSSGSNGLWNISGVNNNGGYNDKYYYNSINLPGQMSGAGGFGGSAAFSNGNAANTANCPVIDIRNNIFFMKGSSVVSAQLYAHYTTVTTFAGSTVNYNNIESSASGAAFAPVGYFSGISYFDIVDWQAATNRDANSISANPLFASATNLQPSVGSPVIDAAIPVSVVVDITGLTRNIVTPTIGAYEEAGDFTGPAITYTPLENLLCTTDRTLSPVTITDAGEINITPGTRPRLYFKKSTNANTFVDNTNATDGWKFVEATGTGASPFSFTTVYANVFGGVGSGNVIQYFVVAQDLALAPNISINNGIFATAPTSVALTAASFPLSGTIRQYTLNTGAISADVTIGASGTFTSITKAGGLFAAINAGGITADINAVILDATVTEDGTNALNPVDYGCTGGPYTLTIKPAAGVAATLTGNAPSAIIKLNGADYVTIDGLNTGGSSLAITNTSANTNSAVIWLASEGVNDGATGNSIKNCTVTGNSGTTTFAGIISCGSVIGSNAAEPNSNNIFQGNTISGCQYGIAVFGPPEFESGTLITQNTIGTPANTIGFSGITVTNETYTAIVDNTVQHVLTNSTMAGAGGIALIGTTNNVTIANNTIKNISSGAESSGTSSISGIHISEYSAFANVNANFVTGIANTNPGGFGVRGLNVLGNFSVISNNSVSDISCFQDTDNAYWPAGIAISSSATASDIYYNSVYLSGTHPGFTATAGASAALLINSTGGSHDIRNNIFSNAYDNTTSAGDKSYAIYSTASSGSGFLNINFNDYFVSGSAAVLGSLNQTDAADIAAWRVLSGQDINSIEVNPLFATTTILKPSTASPVAAAGTPVPVLVDITGFTRNITTPTIGAYEQVGDDTGPTIAYDNLGNSLCLVNKTLAPVTISDISGVNIAPGTRPRLYYKKSSNANTVIDNTNASNGWKYAEATGTGGSPFSFTTDYSLLNGGVAAGDNIQYFVIAQDLAGTPNVGISNGTFAVAPSNVALTAAAFPLTGQINQYALAAGLGADVTIGSGGTFPTITGPGGLFEALNNGGLTANINARIIGTPITEPGTIALNAISYPCAAGPFTLTIKPDAGVAAVLNGNNSGGAIIKLNGADHITIDGVNSGGSSLSINNTSESLTSAVIWIASAGSGNGATNNTIKNCTISGATNSTTLAGIVAGSGNLLGYPAEASNSGNIISGNTIRTAQNGIYISGFTGALDQGWTVEKNTIGSVNAAEKMAFRGIFIGSVQNMSVSNNTILGVVSTANCSSTLSGIQVGYAVSGGSIFNNKISKIRQTNTKGWGSNGIFLAASSPASGLNVYNNVIYDVSSYGFNYPSAIDNGYGIMVQSGGGYNIRFNSIRLTTDQADTLSITAAINISENMISAGSLELRDNIFSNTQASSNRFAIYSNTANTVFGNINYNDYHSTGMLGNYLGTNQAGIAAWRSATGQDVNSIDGDPLFTSSTDLSLLPGSPAIGAGISIAGITTDITGSARTNPPAIGAYESRIAISVQIFLQGAYSVALSRHKDVTTLWRDVLNIHALNQPYNTPEFGNYNGGENVPAGFFTSTGAATDIVDWVLVELRDAGSPATIINRRAAFVREDGVVVDLDGVSGVSFNGIASGNYHIMIRHRNHLGIRTPVAQLIQGNTAAPTVYDFSFAQAQAYQNPVILANPAPNNNPAMKDLGSGRFGLWGGNANSNSDVKFTGLNNDAGVIIAALGGQQGTVLDAVYNSSDLNLDGAVKYTGLNNDAGVLISVLSAVQSAVYSQHH